MEEVRIQVVNTDVQKYVASFPKELTKKGSYKKDLLQYSMAVAEAITAYFLDGRFRFAVKFNTTQYAEYAHVYLDALQLPNAQQVGYNFFIDYFTSRNTPVAWVVSARLMDFTTLLEAKIKIMGYGVKWVVPTEKQSPTEVVATMTFEDICTLLL